MFDAHLCLSGVLMWGDRIPGFDRIWDLVLTWNATMGVPNLVDPAFCFMHQIHGCVNTVCAMRDLECVIVRLR